jgi:choice-of-anchor A domain-containing protein
VQYVRPLLPALALLLAHTSLSAGTLGIANDFNVFVRGDFAPISDATGRIAVGGNATLSNYGVGNPQHVPLSADPNRYDLIVRGNLNFQSGQVYRGSVWAGTGTVSPQVGFQVPGAGFRTPPATPSPLDFDAAIQYLLDASSQWGALAANGTTQFQFGGLTLTGTSQTLNVFSVLGSQLSTANNLSIHVPTGSTVLVNITGTGTQANPIRMANMGFSINGNSNFSNDSNAQFRRVLFNLPQAQHLQISGVGVLGSVLAINAASAGGSGGNVNGTFIANSHSGSLEFHNYPFLGNLPDVQSSVPEPATFALMAAGLGAMLLARRRRK